MFCIFTLLKLTLCSHPDFARSENRMVTPWVVNCGIKWCCLSFSKIRLVCGTCIKESPRYSLLDTGSIVSINHIYHHWCFAAKYQEGSEWQVDMKLPRRNVGRKGVDGSAPIRDRSNLWPKGIIPYTIAYSIRKFSKFLIISFIWKKLMSR